MPWKEASVYRNSAPPPWGRASMLIIWYPTVWENYLFSICLFILSVWTFPYLFYIGLFIIQDYFIAHVVSALANGSSFSQWLCSLDALPSLPLAVCFAEPLLSDPRRCFRLILPILETAISPRSPSPFYWRIVVKPKSWARGVLTCYRDGISFRTS